MPRGRQLAAQPDRDFTEVDLSFAAGQVGLRDEPTRLAAALLDADLGLAPGDIGPDHRVGDVGHHSLVDQPGEDAGGGVPLLAWRIQIGDQDLIDEGLERVELRGPGRIGARWAGQAEPRAAFTVRQPSWWVRCNRRSDIPARASRRIAAYRSTLDGCRRPLLTCSEPSPCGPLSGVGRSWVRLERRQRR